MQTQLPTNPGWKTSELHFAIGIALWIIQLTQTGSLTPQDGALYTTAIVIAYGLYRTLHKILPPPHPTPTPTPQKTTEAQRN